MRFFNLLKRLPPLCFLALAWLAHNTFRRSPLPNSVPPFIRFFNQRSIMAFSWAAERTFMGSPMRMRVDVPKIVPPFMRRRACFTLQGSGLIRVDVEGNPKGLFRLRSLKIVPPFIWLRCFKCFRTMGSNRRDDVCING